MAFYDSVDAIYGTGVYGSASYGIVTPNVALTGVSGTALTRTVHINAFEIDITEPLYGPNALVGSIGTLEFANTVTLTGVAGTVQIGTISPNIAFGITGVSATGQVNTLTENVTEKVTGVLATGIINGAGLSIRSINRVPITGAGMTGSIGVVSLNIIEVISTGILATTATNSVQVNISEKLASVSATGSIGSLEHSNTVTLTGVEGVAQVGEVQEHLTEQIATGVLATGAIGTLKINVKKLLTSVSATFNVGIITATGVQFDFEAIKALYDRSRTVYVEGFTEAASERTVYVQREIRLVYVEEFTEAASERTVYVQREVRLVYVERFSTSAERRARASKAA